MQYQREINIIECEEVYPPSEDTFLLLDLLNVGRGARVLEMGPGTGLITCHLAAASARVTAADINPKAVKCTLANLRRNGLPGEVIESNLFAKITERFDTIVFNPPYCPGKRDDLMSLAWAGGPDGVAITAAFLKDAPHYLRPGGKIVLLLSTEMEKTALESALSPFQRSRLGGRRLFFEELWVEELTPIQYEEKGAEQTK